MNRDSRRKLMAVARKYCINVAAAQNEFSSVIENLKSDEEEKLGNLPESLQDSLMAENMETAIEQMEDIETSLENAESCCEEIAELAGINLPVITAPEIFKETNNAEPRSHRFQILLSENAMKQIKIQAMKAGISCNEFICRALEKKLEETYE